MRSRSATALMTRMLDVRAGAQVGVRTSRDHIQQVAYRVLFIRAYASQREDSSCLHQRGAAGFRLDLSEWRFPPWGIWNTVSAQFSSKDDCPTRQADSQSGVLAPTGE